MIVNLKPADLPLTVPTATVTAPKILLVGNPNVGKSVLFNALTGAYTTVSNYPGTSVEVSRGHCEIAGVALRGSRYSRDVFPAADHRGGKGGAGHPAAGAPARGAARHRCAQSRAHAADDPATGGGRIAGDRGGEHPRRSRASRDAHRSTPAAGEAGGAGDRRGHGPPARTGGNSGGHCRLRPEAGGVRLCRRPRGGYR